MDRDNQGWSLFTVTTDILRGTTLAGSNMGHPTGK